MILTELCPADDTTFTECVPPCSSLGDVHEGSVFTVDGDMVILESFTSSSNADAKVG